MKDKDIKHLEWVYERMKYVHNENENYDYMIRFRDVLEALRQPPVSGSCQHEFVWLIPDEDDNLDRKCEKCGFVEWHDR